MQQSQIILKNAEASREKEDFLAALKYTDEALVAFSEEGNGLEFAEILASRFLTLRHLFEKTGNRNYMIIAKQDVLASVEIAKKCGDQKALAIPLFNLGKAYETLEEYKKAVDIYQEAIINMQNNPAEGHKSKAELQEMILHLSFAQYKSGDKTATDRLEEALKTLEAETEDKYKKDVWLSGGYMDLAEILASSSPAKSQEVLNKAEGIINANPELTIRKRQLEALKKTLAK
jgi:tetratricopeptide (TPR) repeat protein